ncbi:MAG TPA: 5-deoxy-glucuronate isomerase [Syntrophorhabdus sp.]|jgi:5-deoxy-D-glucuronate isomerase|nr:5-deoxy-glucuronate isomerase [Syntrophorhabdus sp.]OPX94457.1 MAG: 5-deoxy-glucuronate isomerase [Syntrophorhabdus sp. PtaB.Bin027]OQB77972.1 MAG: 5-deoxy-glucuronate isomerase [Deltaproteobacteria bacterium ADurb.Bin135]HNQ45475.1 5-deoxy-glucuronate isomerase [Syntrophorhabdus sp.]HPB38595.1 5-deoxy-glucuronate isomerase [Syntrophorhabdus sp.]
MSYRWNNEKRLMTLEVTGEENLLCFDTGSEKAEVYLEGGNIARVVCEVSGITTTIDRSEAKKIIVGEGNYERAVYHYLTPNGPCPTLRLGITKHNAYGTWSSLPHPFELMPEKGFEEVFFYLLEGGSERAVQVGRGIWFNGSSVEDAWFVHDHSWSTIPMGYHPVVGEPGVHVSYVWAYLAKKKEWEKI